MDQPNSTEQAFENAPVANSQSTNEGTVQTDTANVQSTEAEPIDYKEKFSASAREAQKLYEEKKELERRLAERDAEERGTSNDLYPGFEQLDPEAQKNLLAFKQTVERGVKEDLYKDPAISHSLKLYNETKFDRAFEAVAAKYPELKESRDDFKSKYFQPNNTPDNIEAILQDLGKVYLFDKVRDMGAEEERAKSNRIDIERAKGGDKTPKHTSRSLEEWNRIAQENPAKFAAMSKEYQTDLETGKLGE